MHSEAKPTCSPRPSRSHGREPTPRELAVLALISEQVAIPLDQLARFLAVDRHEADRLVAGLRSAGWVVERRFFSADQPWVWLSRRGARLSGTGFDQLAQSARLLTHRRAVNEIRLHLGERAPEGRWICEREAGRLVERDIPVPDGVLEIDGERHAIEVELSRKSRPALATVLHSHSARYDAVVYFCGPQTRSLLEQMRASRRWPKLVVRAVPRMQELLQTRTRGFGVPVRGTQPVKPAPGRRRRRKRRAPLEPWERRILALVAGQGAIPLDQLARFLDCDDAAVRQTVHHFTGVWLARRASLLADEPDWVWLTERGNRLSEAGFKNYLPSPGALARLRAIGEARLLVERGAPSARWIGWRTLRRELSGSGQIPDAVVEIGDERHAIEVELSKKPKPTAARMIADRSARYDAVVCFCTPRTRRFYERLAAEEHLPKLLIRSLPQEAEHL
ncbi:MAG TPA: hypothetical protein VHU86_04520 [Solirubrobacterales bacterium]|jgi:hypothetical protein|nr:hypothetical protein [Solirubrobacterales bacterium]